MFERDKPNDEIKSFDIDAINTTKIESNRKYIIGKNKKILLAAIAMIGLLSGVGILYYNVNTNSNKPNILNDRKTMFVPMDDITVNLRKGVENNSTWLKIKVTLEVSDQNNYDLVILMMPKIVDIFQIYLKELRKNDLDGSFGIYKIKDEMMMRINSILYPGKIEGILFQDFIIQVL